ncbi:LOW QUALITY PROTEIN: hypothetical protein U9M48_041639 [Paspalum notatum var. saurae]|uniref:Uncharacterized protein n=1 Tax=Paspalum notatum var. saurae TaxID=547442 RepID=A0AAQ3XGR5_PASNO
MADMVVSAYNGVMSSLLSKLSVMLIDQYRQRKGLRKDVEFLCRELNDMNAALERLAGMETLDVQTKVWRVKVREMAYDIEDCIDIFMHRLGQGDDKDGLFWKIVHKIRELREHYQHANKIQELKVRVEELSQCRDRYKIDETIPKSRKVEVDPRLPALFEDAKRLVGIDGPREEINKLLMEEGDDTNSRELKSGVHRFGGLGKTTLANQVHSKIKNEFECTAFVSVSRTPDMLIILKDILNRVGYGRLEMEDGVQKLIEILRTHLMNRRYLVVIDDLWSTNDWSTIKCAFVENNKGSRVITTTRHQDVAATCCFPCPSHVYPMKPLNEHHSRRLFLRRLFDTEDDCPKQFGDISSDVLRKCKGVPLAITSIASLLAKQSMNADIWEKICNSLGSELDTNPTMEWMRHVLNLSYNDLPHELKTCLLYLGAYPEDQMIDKYDLLRKWIAEGFVSEKYGLGLEEAAENCFNELINRSMIEPLFSTCGEVSGCLVHDLMLDLIISKCKEENFITIIGMRFAVKGALQVSHQFKYRGTALAAEKMGLPRVRSYISFLVADCIPDLSKFELLRILDVVGDSYHHLSMLLDLSAINHLFLLRYLRVSGFHLELPKKFGRLNRLMTLEISRTMLYPRNQLSDFTSLASLRHLALPSLRLFEGSVVLRNGLSKLTNLHTLSGFVIGSNFIECIKELGELTNLRDLRLIYSRPGDLEVNRGTVLAASLEKLGNSSLRSLFCQDRSYANAPTTQFWSNCMTHPQHLQKLRLDGVLHKVPNWMVHADRLTYLDRLIVQELRSDGIQVLAQLPCLMYLRLEAKTIPERNIIIHPNTFPSLKRLDLFCELSCLTFESAAMPQLQILRVFFDGHEQVATIEQLQEGSPVRGIEHLASLEEITLRMYAKCGHGSKIKAACRDAITRHRRSQAIRISVDCPECDENGNMIIMVVSAFTGVMDSLLSKLSDLLTDQYRQRKGLRRDIEFLRNELVHMNSATQKLAGRESLDPRKSVEGPGS